MVCSGRRTLSTVVAPTDFKDRLAAAMDRAGVDATRLSKALGISYQAISKLLDGRSKSMSSANNSAAAKFLGVNPDWLATGRSGMLSPGLLGAALLSDPALDEPRNPDLTLSQALPVVIRAMVNAAPEVQEELAQVLALLARTRSDLYAKRVAELLDPRSMPEPPKPDLARHRL